LRPNFLREADIGFNRIGSGDVFKFMALIEEIISIPLHMY
jgi:hypothetical protein